jgi:hypothetical protein
MRRILQGDQVLVVGRHWNSKLHDGCPAVGQQPLPESRIGPGLGNDLGTITGIPMVLDQDFLCVDELIRLQAARPECLLDGSSPSFDGGYVVSLINHGWISL